MAEDIKEVGARGRCMVEVNIGIHLGRFVLGYGKTINLWVEDIYILQNHSSSSEFSSF